MFSKQDFNGKALIHLYAYTDWFLFDEGNVGWLGPEIAHQVR